MTRGTLQHAADRAWSRATGDPDAVGQWAEYDRLRAVSVTLHAALSTAEDELRAAQVALTTKCTGKDQARAIVTAAGKVRAAEDAVADAKRAQAEYSHGPYALAGRALHDGVQRRAAVVAQWGAALDEKVQAQRVLGQEPGVDVEDAVLTYCTVQNELRLAQVRTRLESAEQVVATRKSMIQSGEQAQYVKSAEAEVKRLRSVLAAG